MSVQTKQGKTMYSYPPLPFPYSQWGLTLWIGGWLVFYAYCLWLVCTKPRRLRTFDVGGITLLFFVIVHLQSFPQHHLIQVNNIGLVLFVITLLITGIAGYVCCCKYQTYFSDTHRTLQDLEGLFVLLQVFACSVAIISFFLLVPSHVDTAEHWRTRSCRNNMNYISIALWDSFEVKEDSFPPTASGNPLLSWRVDLLPYLDQEPLYERYDKTIAWNSGSNIDVAKTEVEHFQCPSDPFPTTSEGYQKTAYAALTGKDAVWDKSLPRSIDGVIQGDGLSQTLMLVEACGQNIAWSEPRDVDLTVIPVGVNLAGKRKGMSQGMLSSFHWSGAHAAFADGSVRSISKETDPTVLKALTTATGGEELEYDDF